MDKNIIKVIYHDEEPAIYVKLADDFVTNPNAESDLLYALLGGPKHLVIDELEDGYLIKREQPPTNSQEEK